MLQKTEEMIIADRNKKSEKSHAIRKDLAALGILKSSRLVHLEEFLYSILTSIL